MLKNWIFFAFLTFQFSNGQNIGDFVKDFEKKEGFFDTFYDKKSGKIYIKIDSLNQDFLYYPSLVQGVGSNDIGLDRGRLGQELVVRFIKAGHRVLLEAQNLSYRASSTNIQEKLAVNESFAKSIIYGTEVKAETANSVLIELTSFLMQDLIGAAADISRTKQGVYRLDLSKSALGTIKNFPNNSEFDQILTLTGDNPGPYLREVVPIASIVSIVQHVSFVKLPDLNSYTPKKFDPRVGYNHISFFDYSQPISSNIEQKWIVRHKLEKKDPAALISEAKEPIIYYLDPGTPEPIKSALLEGAKWWSAAFEFAGFKDAFQVKILPENADPMDIRYNVVQWVHRSTRGWSYGSSIIDPRTGQILKGKVTLGSLRVRQDYLIASAYIADYAAEQPKDDLMLKMSLDRLKQLSAHEIGHTLGLPHNYVSSTQGRSSVMDYPHPLIELKPDGGFDLSNAYTNTIGEYDKLSILWGYGSENDQEVFNKIKTRGMSFLTDQDARPEGSAHPKTHLWDNGQDPVAEFKRIKKLRSAALEKFGPQNLPKSMPKSSLEELLVPLYMGHRYQLEALSKSLGGINYSNTLNNGEDDRIVYVPAGVQRDALFEMQETLKPEFLKLPTHILLEIPPRAYGFDANSREVFKKRTGISFDAFAPAEAAASHTLRLLLHPERITRLAHQNALFEKLPSFLEVILSTNKLLWQNSTVYSKNDYNSNIQRMVAMKYLDHLMQIATNKDLSTEIRSNALFGIEEIRDYLLKNSYLNGGGFASLTLLKIRQFEEHPSDQIYSQPLSLPDGQPIDQDYEWLSNLCSH